MEGVQWFLPRLLLLSVELGGRKRVCEIKWTPAAYASSSPTTCLPLTCRPTYNVGPALKATYLCLACKPIPIMGVFYQCTNMS